MSLCKSKCIEASCTNSADLFVNFSKFHKICKNHYDIYYDGYRPLITCSFCENNIKFVPIYSNKMTFDRPEVPIEEQYPLPEKQDALINNNLDEGKVTESYQTHETSSNYVNPQLCFICQTLTNQYRPELNKHICENDYSYYYYYLNDCQICSNFYAYKLYCEHTFCKGCWESSSNSCKICMDNQVYNMTVNEVIDEQKANPIEENNPSEVINMKINYEPENNSKIEVTSEQIANDIEEIKTHPSNEKENANTGASNICKSCNKQGKYFSKSDCGCVFCPSCTISSCEHRQVKCTQCDSTKSLKTLLCGNIFCRSCKSSHKCEQCNKFCELCHKETDVKAEQFQHSSIFSCTCTENYQLFMNICMECKIKTFQGTQKNIKCEHGFCISCLNKHLCELCSICSNCNKNNSLFFFDCLHPRCYNCRNYKSCKLCKPCVFCKKKESIIIFKSCGHSVCFEHKNRNNCEECENIKECLVCDEKKNERFCPHYYCENCYAYCRKCKCSLCSRNRCYWSYECGHRLCIDCTPKSDKCIICSALCILCNSKFNHKLPCEHQFCSAHNNESYCAACESNRFCRNCSSATGLKEITCYHGYCINCLKKGTCYGCKCQKHKKNSCLVIKECRHVHCESLVDNGCVECECVNCLKKIGLKGYTRPECGHTFCNECLTGKCLMCSGDPRCKTCKEMKKYFQLCIHGLCKKCFGTSDCGCKAEIYERVKNNKCGRCKMRKTITSFKKFFYVSNCIECQDNPS